MEKFTVTVNEVTYEVLPVEVGHAMAYETTIKIVFRPDHGHFERVISYQAPDSAFEFWPVNSV